MNNGAIFYRGQELSLSEAFALFMRDVIEKDVQKCDGFVEGMCPYKWLHFKLGRSESVVRKWVIPFDDGGNLPTLEVFLTLAQLTRTEKFIEFIAALIKEPRQTQAEYSRVIKKLAATMINYGEQLEILAEEYEKESQPTT